MRIHNSVTVVAALAVVVFTSQNGWCEDFAPLSVEPGREPYTTETHGALVAYIADRLLGASFSFRAECGGQVLVEGEVMKPGRRAVFQLDLTALPTGRSEVICQAIDLGDADTVLSAKATIQRLPAKSHVTKIDFTRRCLLVDGEPFFPFGFYTDANPSISTPVEEIRHGFNVIAPYSGGSAARSAEALTQTRAFLDKCAEVGMHVSYDLRPVAERAPSEEKWALLRAEVEALRDHPAILCWSISDEPADRQFEPGILLESYRFIKELDPYHPVTMVFCHHVLLHKYIGALDFVLRDWYPIPNHPVVSVADVAQYMDRTIGYLMPWCFVPQAFGGSWAWAREPTAAENRAMTYLALISGATGIQYFIRRPPMENPISPLLWASCREVALETAELAPAILSEAPRPRVAYATEGIFARAYEHRGHYTIIAVNVENEPRAFEVSLADGGFTGQADVLFENREVAVTSGRIHDGVDAFGTRAYRFRSPDYVADDLAIAPENLYVNPSFERAANTGTPDGCYVGGTERHVTIAVDPWQARHGLHALRLTSLGETGSLWVTMSPFPVEGDVPYRVSVWAKADAEGMAFTLDAQLLGIRRGDARYELSQEWQEYEAIGVANRTTQREATLGLHVEGTGTAWFDLLQTTPIETMVNQQSDGASFALTAGGIRLECDARGHVVGLRDAATGANRMPVGASSALLSFVYDGQAQASSTATYDAERGLLTLHYDVGLRSAEIEVREKPSHLTFELLSYDGATPEEVVWGPFFCTLDETIGETIGVVQGGGAAFGVQALNIKTLGGARATEGGSAVYAKSKDYTRPIKHSKLGRDDTPGLAGPDATVLGSKIALFGSPAVAALETMGEIELAEGLPHPMLNGVWAKVSPDATRSYLIAPFTEDSLAPVLDVAKAAGLRYVYNGNPFESWGHFGLNRSAFPDGVASLRRCVEQAEAVGIHLGVHTLSNFIQPNDPYVTPVPDPRLLRYGTTAITGDVSADGTRIPVDDPAPFRHSDVMHTAVIGEELVTYDAISDSEPWALLKCTRGAFGTTAAQHAKGVAIACLWDHPYGVFFPNIELQDEMAIRIAELFNATGLQQISFDGLEGCQNTGYGAYAEARFVKTTYDAWQSDVINDSSQLKHFTWHMHTRMNWGEPWGRAMREGMPEYRFKNQAYFQRNLLPPMLGWFEIRVAGNGLEATTIDEVEWVLAKSAGFGAGCAWQTSLYALARLGNGAALLEGIRAWDSLRHAGSFTEAQRARLRDPEKEFHLARTGDSEWQITPVSFSPPLHAEAASATTRGAVEGTWETTNPFARQPLQFTLRAVAEGENVAEASLDTPTFTVGGSEVSFDVAVMPGQHLVLEQDGRAVVFDENWNEVAQVAPLQPIPQLVQGPQRVAFCGSISGRADVSAEVRLRMVGAPDPVR